MKILNEVMESGKFFNLRKKKNFLGIEIVEWSVGVT